MDAKTHNKHGLGCRPDELDKRDLTFGDYLKPQKLPQVLDWSNKLWPVKDQKNKPHCVGFSGASLKVHQELVEHDEIYGFSGEELYEECKKIDGVSGEGTTIRDLMKVLRSVGALWRGRAYKVSSYLRLQTIRDYEFSLASSGPFVFGAKIFEPFVKSPGLINLPEEAGGGLGHHALLAVGFDKKDRHLKFLNSWSANWGMGGYGMMTYDYAQKYIHSAWAAVDMTDKVVQSFIDTRSLKAQLSLIDLDNKPIL